jgi:hypothetical protein
VEALVKIRNPVAAKEGGRHGAGTEKGNESVWSRMADEMEGNLELKLCGEA